MTFHPPELSSPGRLADRLQTALIRHGIAWRHWARPVSPGFKAASVLVLLGMQAPDGEAVREPCLILTRRSRFVSQPGDLCFPGGGTAPLMDCFLAGLLLLPGFPLWQPVFRPKGLWKGPRYRLARWFATGLREGYEEIRLRPLSVSFLGAMAPQRVTHFRRVIFPVVGWTRQTGGFVPNREVERIVPIPLRYFFDVGAYGRYRVVYTTPVSGGTIPRPQTFPCLVYSLGNERDLLWGATYRIVMRLLRDVFGFVPPGHARGPVFSGTIGRDYFGGGKIRAAGSGESVSG